MYQDVPKNLDFPELENRIQRFWEEKKIFEKLVAQNRGSKKRFRFVDGPITANNPMGVHHAWGRTIKDLYHRYKAMQGCEARYQNGFDCQGLWVEVEVEKELGFGSKKDIESFGIDRFVDKCKERVDRYSKIQTQQSIRLGYWMDWQNSYYTMAPENNYAIWHFLRKCHELGWIYKGTDVMPWCIRCGIALSDMEIATEGYREMTHKSVFIRLPLKGRSHEHLLVWTTTPWTLTSNTAVAVHPDLTYLKVRQDKEIYYLAASRKEVLRGSYDVLAELPGTELVGLEYQGPFDDLPAQRGVKHRTVAWKEVTESEGTGMVHIAPGCGKEDFALGKEEKLAVVAPLDEAGVYKEGFGWLTGRNVQTVADDVLADLEKRGILYHAHPYTHRYPECWRCHSELVFRLVEEWFISMGPLYDKPASEVTAEEKAKSLRYRIMDSVRQARWMPEFGLERELDWLRNMGDWCISKKRYWGLALPVFECACGNFDVIGGYEELKARAVKGWNEFLGHTPHRPWIDAVKVSCSKCGKEASRVRDVGNPWLDAGIVMFSTVVPPVECYTPDKEKSGIYHYDPSQVYPQNREYWRPWFPAEFITECFPGQFRNWFYAVLTMSTVLEGRSPFEKLLGHALVKDAKGADMHKSAGNAIWFDDAAEKMGAEVMRWIFCAQNPVQNLNFGFELAAEVKRRLLTLHNVYSFYVTYAKLDGFSPAGKKIDQSKLSLLDRWILSELQLLVRAARERLDDYDASTVCRRIEAFVEDLSTWYVRRSRRRFWKSESDSDKEAAYLTLHACLETLLRLMAPILPFWTEEMYQNLVRSADPKAPESVHLTSYPEVDAALIDEALSEEMALVRRVVSMGHAARRDAKLKVRQPLATLLVRAGKRAAAAVARHAELVADEVNVKKVEPLADGEELVDHKARGITSRIGPRFAAHSKAVAQAVSALSSAEVKKFKGEGKLSLSLPFGTAELTTDDVQFSTVSREGFAAKEEAGDVVALDTRLTQELVAEGHVRELVHKMQNLRKETGLELSDRIRIAYKAEPALAKAIEAHRAYIMTETLAVTLAPGETQGAEPTEVNGMKVALQIERA